MNSPGKSIFVLWVAMLIFNSTIFLKTLCAQDINRAPVMRNDLLEKGEFIQIPGPNPILTAGPEGAWDDYIIETGGVLKDFGTYYLYYHGSRQKPLWAYQTGIATSRNPLGPFTKYEKNPVITIGPKGSWDDMHAAHAIIIKEGINKYYLWYCGHSFDYASEKWSIGLATASSPLGPWEKFENNPIIDDFGYVSAVTKVNGKYYLYSQYPIGSTANDYGPIALAVADKPEGPYERYQGNPVIAKGQWGEWDDGGFSDVAINYSAGVFHAFYGGVKAYEPRMLSRESIGYAYSFDGYNWIKYGLNPVATRDANPNAASFAELRTIWEPPFIYVYHTLRYKVLIPNSWWFSCIIRPKLFGFNALRQQHV